MLAVEGKREHEELSADDGELFKDDSADGDETVGETAEAAGGREESKRKREWNTRGDPPGRTAQAQAKAQRHEACRA